MNNIPKPWQIEHYKKAYPPGTRLELTSPMIGEDIPAGTKGTVVCVDDIGSIHMKWDNGRGLALIPGEDSFRRITEEPVMQTPPAKQKKKDRGLDR